MNAKREVYCRPGWYYTIIMLDQPLVLTRTVFVMWGRVCPVLISVEICSERRHVCTPVAGNIMTLWTLTWVLNGYDIAGQGGIIHSVVLDQALVLILFLECYVRQGVLYANFSRKQWFRHVSCENRAKRFLTSYFVMCGRVLNELRWELPVLHLFIYYSTFGFENGSTYKIAPPLPLP